MSCQWRRPMIRSIAENIRRMKHGVLELCNMFSCEGFAIERRASSPPSAMSLHTLLVKRSFHYSGGLWQKVIKGGFPEGSVLLQSWVLLLRHRVVFRPVVGPGYGFASPKRISSLYTQVMRQVTSQDLASPSQVPSGDLKEESLKQATSPRWVLMHYNYHSLFPEAAHTYLTALIWALGNINEQNHLKKESQYQIACWLEYESYDTSPHVWFRLS